MPASQMWVALIFALFLYGVPLIGAILVWSSFIDPAKAPAPPLRIAALSLATLSVLWGFAGLAIVYLIRPMPRFDHSIETVGLVLSVPAVLASFGDMRRPQLQASRMVLAISCWMLFLWGLQVCLL